MMEILNTCACQFFIIYSIYSSIWIVVVEGETLNTKTNIYLTSKVLNWGQVTSISKSLIYMYIGDFL